MTEITSPPEPPVAPTKPHTWERPTGAVDDPYAWLRNREDPDTIAYLEAENAYAAAFFERHADQVEELFAEIKSRVQETDESVPVRHGPWWYVTRTIEGESYPVFCRGRSIDDAADVILDCNAEAAGHEYFDVHAVDASPDHSLLAWSSDIDGGERYTLRVRDLATGDDLPDELTGTSSWGGVAWSSDGRWLLYARPDEAMRPYQIWRHRLGTPVADDELVIEEDDERFFLGVSRPAASSGSSSTAQSNTTSEVSVVPAADPTAPPVLVRERVSEVEYDVDHWGDRFVVLTNLDAPDFRVMTAPLDEPGEWTELLPHVPGRRFTTVQPFAGHLVLHEWSDAQPKVLVLFPDGRQQALDFGAEPHDLELGANPEWDTTSLRVSYQSLTTPRRCTTSTSSPASASCASRRRRRASTSPVRVDAHVGDGAGRHGGARRRRPPRRHRPRRHGAGRRLRLRVVRGLDAAVVLGRPPVAARPWRRVGARPPARRRRARAALVPRRQAAQQAQHVHRHAGGDRARRRRALRRPRAGRASAAAAPADCSSARASRCARTCSAAPSPRCRSSTS